jgi:hypothetical protein
MEPDSNNDENRLNGSRYDEAIPIYSRLNSLMPNTITHIK